jgi:hypothetical protein
MAGSATLNVKVLVDAAQAASGLNQVAGKFQEFAGNAVKLFAGAFAFDKIMDGVKSVVTAASGMEQAMGGVDRIFQDSAQTIHDWASDTGDAFRVPALEAERFATTLGNSLIQAGRSTAEAATEVQSLAQVAADLASAYGGDVVDALDAVNAAISKGEWERLESFGVTVKADDLAPEIDRIAASMGGMTDANRGAIETQARINLLMKEAAPAMGAAAADAQTFTGRVDSLKEKVNNAAGTIGGPLLDGFGSLIDRLASAVPFLTTLGAGLATVVGWVVQLPTPLFAAAAAMAAFALAAAAGWVSSLVSGFSAASTALLNFYINAKLVQAQAVVTGRSMSTMGAMARTALPAVGSALRSIGPALGLGVLVIAITGIIDKLNDAGEAFDDVQSRMGEVTAELRKTGGAWTDTANKMFTAKFADSKAFQQLVAEGFSANEILEILTGTWEHWVDVQHSGKGTGLTTDTINEVNAFRDLHGVLPQVAAEQGKFNELTETGSETVETFEDALKRLNSTLSDQQAHFKLLAENTEVAHLLDNLAAAQAEVARGGAALNAMIDQGQGRSRDYERNTLAWSDSVTKLGDAFKQTAEDGKLNMDLISNWDIGGIAREMPELGSALLDVRDNLGEFVQSAFVASGGMSNFEAGLAGANTAMRQSEADVRAMLAPLGLAPEVVDSVVASLGILDETELREKELKIAAEDFEARKTALYWESITFDPIEQKFVTTIPDAQTIADQLNSSLPAKTEVPITPVVQPPTFGSQLMSGLFGNLFGGGAVTTPPVTVPTTVGAPTNVPAGAVGAALGGAAATAGMVTVPISANANGANAIMNAFVNEIRSTTVQIKGEAAQANNTIRAVIGGQYQTTVHLMGDSVPVNNTIRAVIGGQYSTTVHINGDNGPAISAIRSITTGYYSATVHINAEASGFYSVWNSLPTNKTITVTVNQVQGSVVAPPAPGGLTAAPAVAADVRAFSTAPTLQGGRASRTSKAAAAPGSSVTNINVEVGVGDADAIARAVKRVILARDRRTGGVVVGEMRARVGHS